MHVWSVEQWFILPRVYQMIWQEVNIQRLHFCYSFDCYCCTLLFQVLINASHTHQLKVKDAARCQ